MVFTKSFPLLWMLLVSLSASSDAGFLMRDKKLKDSATAVDTGAPSKDELLALSAQVQVAQQARDDAVRVQEATAASLSKLQQDMQDLRKDTDVHIAELSQSSDAAKQITGASRLAEVKARYEREIASAATFAAEQEIIVRRRFENELVQAAETSATKQAALRARYENELEVASAVLTSKEAEFKKELERTLSESSAASAAREKEVTASLDQKQGELMAVIAQKDAATAEAEATFAASNKELNGKLQAADSKWQDVNQKISAAKEEVTGEMKKEMGESVAKLNDELEALEKENTSLQEERGGLKETVAAQEKKFLKLQEESQSALSTVLAANDKEAEALQKKLGIALSAQKALDKETRVISKKLAIMKEEYDEVAEVSLLQFRSLMILVVCGFITLLLRHLTHFLDSLLVAQDLQYWEGLFGERSYCNFTHMREDVVDSVESAQQATSERFHAAGRWIVETQQSMFDTIKTTYARLIQAKDDTTVAATKQYSRALDSSAPYTNKANDLYVRHAKGHVDGVKEKARPHYEKHVVPPLDKATSVFKEIATGAKNGCAMTMAEIVLQFENSCPKAIKFFNNFPNVQESLKAPCSKPEETVGTVFKATLVLLAILNRRILWRLFVGSVHFVLRILWFFMPFRFFMSTSSPSKADPNAATAAHELGQ